MLEIPVGNPAGLRPLDVVTGAMLGSDAGAPLPEMPRDIDPLQVLRDELARALEPGNCYVSFSGGRDSSGTLALAADVARERGLPQPIPITIRFPRDSGSREDEFQETIVSHLKLDDWVRIDVLDELELIGPVARRTLRRHGLLFPASSFTMVPLFEAASGGRVVIGMGQSDFYQYWQFSPLADLFLGKRRLRRGDLPRLAYVLLPKSARTAVVKRQPLLTLPWLRPEVAREARHVMAVRTAHAALRYDNALSTERLHRCNLGSMRCLTATSAAAGAEVVVPYYSPAYHAALVQSQGWLGAGGRGSALRNQVGHLLPAEAFGRRDSTNFQRVFWGHRTRAFAESWSGRGVLEDMVDPEGLRESWLADSPDFRSAMLLQLAWLTEEAEGGEEAADEAAAPLAANKA